MHLKLFSFQIIEGDELYETVIQIRSQLHDRSKKIIDSINTKGKSTTKPPTSVQSIIASVKREVIQIFVRQCIKVSYFQVQDIRYNLYHLNFCVIDCNHIFQKQGN